MLHFTKSRAILPLALIAAVAATLFQGAAFAGTPMEPNGRNILVSVKGLDLANPRDVAVLNARLKSAARSVCSTPDIRGLSALAQRSACEELALATAGKKRDTLIAEAQGQSVRTAAVVSQAPAIN